MKRELLCSCSVLTIFPGMYFNVVTQHYRQASRQASRPDQFFVECVLPRLMSETFSTAGVSEFMSTNTSSLNTTVETK